MRIKKFLFIIVVIACAALSAHAYAENFQDAFTLFQPLFEEGKSPWTLTKNQTVFFANRFKGFTCRGLRTTLGTEKYYCVSDKNTFKGKYTMIFDFGYGETLVSAELQISHPDLDTYLENSSYEAWLTHMENAVRNYENLSVTDNYLQVIDEINHIFYDINTVPYKNIKFNDNVIFSTGHITNGKNGKNVLVMVFSESQWFYLNQTLYVVDSETGKGEYRTVYTDGLDVD